jgi:thiosulfate/3-mercaptopyruvate sulfurtransferase
VTPRIQVDPDWVAEHLDDPAVRVVEVDMSPAPYSAGHIPGAVLWDAYRDLHHTDYTPIDPDELDAVLSRSGITPESTAVLYGQGWGICVILGGAGCLAARSRTLANRSRS